MTRNIIQEEKSMDTAVRVQPRSSRYAFTMIELIFVIVILGILAVVALPHFLKMKESSEDAVATSFASTMYRTVGHSLWAKSIASDANGSIKADTDGDNSKFYGKSLDVYVDIPTFFDASTVDFSKCVSSGAAQPFLQKSTDGRYNIFCKDGTEVAAPMFVASKDANYTF